MWESLEKLGVIEDEIKFRKEMEKDYNEIFIRIYRNLAYSYIEKAWSENTEQSEKIVDLEEKLLEKFGG
jgi:hypothetical protein